MTSTLILYKDCKILPERNFKVDFLSDYLSSLAKTYINDFQYIKHQLGTKIKISRDQQLLDYIQNNNYNYCSIRNGSEKECYYFIIGKKWLAENCVELTLLLDVINTFENDIVLSNKTKILRCHKDRFKIVDNKIYPLIDFYNEGITPVLFKQSEQELFHLYSNGSAEENSFYLIYTTQQEPTSQLPNPAVDCFLCADEKMTISGIIEQRQYGSIDVRDYIAPIVPTRLKGSDGLFIYGNDGNVGAYVKYAKHSNKNKTRTMTINNSDECIQIWVNLDVFGAYKAHCSKFTRTNNEWVLTEEAEWDNLKVNFEYGNTLHIRMLGIEDKTLEELNISPSDIEDAEDILTPQSSDADFTINSISDVDRTDPKIVKIIKLPYAPTPLLKDGDKYIIDRAMWQYDASMEMVKLINTTKSFKTSLNFSFNPFLPLRELYNFPSTLIQKDKKYEPKLFHSDFYLPKFVYDSFSFPFQLEKLREYQEDIDINYVFTSTINSKFLFAFINYDIYGKSEADYDNILPIARNNEVVLYNSSYLDYIRTGFNYDVKSKERQATTTIASTIGGVVGGVLSFAGGVATQNPFLIGLGITTLVSTSVNIISSVNSINQAEQNIRSKLDQLKNQAVSVSGSDDVDLMTYYTEGNKAKYCVYKVSEKMEQALFDLFYYTGYIADYLGLPDKVSRTHFNFVSAEIVYDRLPNIPIEFIQELSNKYKEGITFLHRFLDGSTYKWDFAQEYENFEINLPVQVAEIIADDITLEDINAHKEVILDPDGEFIKLTGLITSSNTGLTIRLRKKSSLAVLQEIDAITFNIGANEILAGIKEGLLIRKVFSTEKDAYIDEDYLITIQVSIGETASISYEDDENDFLSLLLGYIQ